MTTNRAAIASFAMPAASGATGNQGHTIHVTANKPTSAIASMAPVSRTIAARRVPKRSMLSVRPAMSAMSVVAIPLIAWSCLAIGSEMTLARKGPTSSPKSRYPVRRGRRNRRKRSPATDATTSVNPSANAVLVSAALSVWPRRRAHTTPANTSATAIRRLMPASRAGESETRATPIRRNRRPRPPAPAPRHQGRPPARSGRMRCRRCRVRSGQAPRGTSGWTA